jgi:hypothetical protein
MTNEQKPKGFWGTLGDAIARGPSSRPNKNDQQQRQQIRPPKPKSGCCNRGGK